jgi:spermidine/putrescine transport system permease protein
VGRGQGVLSVPEAQARRRRLRLDLTTPTLLGLPLAWLAVFFLVPIVIVALYSVGRLSLDPGPHAVTLAAWHDFLHSPIYLKLFWKSVKMSLIVSVVVVALAYPLAYYLALSGTKRKYVLLLLLIAPFLTSYLLRVLAWKVILGDQGVINSFLVWVQLRSPEHPISQLLYSRFAVMLVLAYIWLPFVALPIFVSLENLDRRLLEAAGDLYASRWRAFIAVTLPLSLPGVFAGTLLTFIPAVGDFINAALLGTRDTQMIGNVIQSKFLNITDYPAAASLSFILMIGILVLVIIYARALGAERLTG